MRAATLCDYSLMAFSSRLTVAGDELVVRRFDAKSLGLAVAFDVRPAQPRRYSTKRRILDQAGDFVSSLLG
jgi:hypothetical protein